MTPQQMVTEFHRAFNCLIDGEMTDQAVATRLRLMGEEFGEVVSAMRVGTRAELAKELADLMYVTIGAAVNFGIDLDKAFRIVHDSNMSKLGPDGVPILREDGKVLKPPTYQAPDMSSAVRDSEHCPEDTPKLGQHADQQCVHPCQNNLMVITDVDGGKFFGWG